MLKISHEHAYEAGRRIAVIGSGISGLSAAWLLDRSADVTLFEAGDYIGGHSNTVDVETARGRIAVDTGFIVHNSRNYPNFTALLKTLDVATEDSDMSFAASMDDGGFEYSGTSLSTLIGQRRNIVRPRFWRMVADIVKFYRRAPVDLRRPGAAAMTLGDYLDQGGYSQSFITDHILPMGGAIWSSTVAEMRAYPLEAFIRFFESHGLLSLTDRPVWRTVKGGSRTYVRRMLEDFTGVVKVSTAISAVRRIAGVGIEVTTATGERSLFDQVVIASHADQALAMLADAAPDERVLLGSFRYTDNRAVLHSDAALMPKRKSVWSSWNYMAGKEGDQDRQLCVTYWMNRLQNLDPAVPLFVTLNPCREPRPEHVHRTIHYTHPLFDAAAIAAQKEIWRIQGRGGVWYAGAHLGHGFHEDGLQSGLAVAEAIGGIRRPWQVGNENGRIHMPVELQAAE